MPDDKDMYRDALRRQVQFFSISSLVCLPNYVYHTELSNGPSVSFLKYETSI